ncbi:hypothetical protein FLONG3_7789 [Fusarium longipes]|uniref:Uncharacterized protein n=1 Tax=Fusarium longipes TaxID=694270 RepID=A0A395SAG2_9HYPO|nr:hypothetical protein FLONG3_7789 [Fusarium longipes]
MSGPLSTTLSSYMEILLSLSFAIMAWHATRASPPPKTALRQVGSLLSTAWVLNNAAQYPSRVAATTFDSCMEGGELSSESRKIFSDIGALCTLHNLLDSYNTINGHPFKDSNDMTLFDVLGLDPTEPPFSPIEESFGPDGKHWQAAKQAIHDADSPQEDIEGYLRAIENKTFVLSGQEDVLGPLQVMAMKQAVKKAFEIDRIRQVYQQMIGHVRGSGFPRFCKWAAMKLKLDEQK